MCETVHNYKWDMDDDDRLEARSSNKYIELVEIIDFFP